MALAWRWMYRSVRRVWTWHRRMVLLVPLLATISHIADAATRVENVRFEQREDEVVVSYDLHGSEEIYTITLKGSSDGGRRFDIVPKTVSGDVGDKVSPGKGKQMVWEALKDVEQLSGDRFVFAVTASWESAEEVELSQVRKQQYVEWLRNFEVRGAEEVELSQIRKQIAMKQRELARTYTQKAIGPRTKNGKLQHGALTFSGCLLNGLGGLVWFGALVDPDESSFVKGMAIVELATAAGMWYSYFKERPKTFHEGWDGNVGRYWRASIAVGLAGDVISYIHDRNIKTEQQLRQEIEELKKKLDKYSLHYHPQTKAVMLSYNVRF
ncbi:MAG TPA: hypothetical protein EYP19_10200 [Desulfobacterales bacterium]|nr:hypothetical protein [Desulfobacterales bacterium]